MIAHSALQTHTKTGTATAAAMPDGPATIAAPGWENVTLNASAPAQDRVPVIVTTVYTIPFVTMKWNVNVKKTMAVKAVKYILVHVNRFAMAAQDHQLMIAIIVSIMPQRISTGSVNVIGNGMVLAVLISFIRDYVIPSVKVVTDQMLTTVWTV